MREFETGAKRDDATGKGRYDLLPWGAIHELAKHCERGALHYGERNVDKGIPQHSLIDSACRHLSMYIQGDAEPYHIVAALWNVAWAVEQEVKRPEMVDLPIKQDKPRTISEIIGAREVRGESEYATSAGTLIDECREESQDKPKTYYDIVAERWPEQLQYLACNGGENCPSKFFIKPRQYRMISSRLCSNSSCNGCWKQPYNGEEIIYGGGVDET